ncbi:TnsA-like heteromeric transposase endonuclease subunit [Microbacterium sp. X-17]|uniref:TnsA-like heteromeric transposase endonuclease subunit n=1 Tax=Microbacterium sp. X-17 TaxID=3144404 RepID=UPI0031F576B2
MWLCSRTWARFVKRERIPPASGSLSQTPGTWHAPISTPPSSFLRTSRHSIDIPYRGRRPQEGRENMPYGRLRYFDTFRNVPPRDEPSIHWLDAYGRPHEVRASADALRTPLELAVPCRRGPKYRGQPSSFGHYIFAQTGQWLWFESETEAAALRLLDHVASISSIATQPFCLVHPDGVRHVPDFFALATDGTRIVVDVRPEALRDDTAAEQFQRTREVCFRIGWLYNVMSGESESIPAQNVRRLSEYRGPDYRPSADVREVVRQTLTVKPSLTWAKFFEHVGGSVSEYELFALMWSRDVGYTFGATIGPETRLWWVSKA